jgi:hypothetical protein
MTAFKLFTFKKADAWTQVSLIVIAIAWMVFEIIKGARDLDLVGMYIISLSAIGFFQLLSFFIHWYINAGDLSKLRKYYSRALLGLLVLLVPPLTPVGLFFLLFLTPGFAIAYIAIIFSEIKPRSFFDL